MILIAPTGSLLAYSANTSGWFVGSSLEARINKIEKTDDYHDFKC
ncbi:MAG TPA: hypothetical protein VI278_08665 [Nitrososphaeraceae archaeon]